MKIILRHLRARRIAGEVGAEVERRIAERNHNKNASMIWTNGRMRSQRPSGETRAGQREPQVVENERIGGEGAENVYTRHAYVGAVALGRIVLTPHNIDHLSTPHRLL